MPTIGDRLSEKQISWAWYAGGWDRAMAGDPDPEFNGFSRFIISRSFISPTMPMALLRRRSTSKTKRT